jgi:hypothetical protein
MIPPPPLPSPFGSPKVKSLNKKRIKESGKKLSHFPIFYLQN